ncbi:MAG: pallilysin-related adhesin [Treponema sp.]|jgi:hypothetical protein|nr:pallilysin-related adhesin [Treponema sp.]
MMKGNFTKIITIIVFLFTALCIAVLMIYPDFFSAQKNERVRRQTRVVLPQTALVNVNMQDTAERLAYEESMNIKASLDEGEILVSVLNDNFDGDPMEEQIAAYRMVIEDKNPVYIAYIDFDESLGEYRRVWNAQTAVNYAGAVAIYTQDLIGDHSPCVLVSGMNGEGRHTLTVFRKTPAELEENVPFIKIAEIRMEGTITVQETNRTQAYQMGIANDKSFSIVAYGHDNESTNILDQIEIIYAYNTESGFYEESKVRRIPGIQIEQQRVRELLSGKRGVFEDFIDGLWYYVDTEGMIDSRQYIYFNPANHEIIFYGDEVQQIFTWQNSNTTRYGLHITSQNISVTTLRRSLDIEIESLERIRVKVFEDVRLKLSVNALWDGSYRKAPSREITASKTIAAPATHIDASYEGSIGRIRFFPDGFYELNSRGNIRKGKYSFFLFNDKKLLELRPQEPVAAPGGARETFLIADAVYEQEETSGEGPRESLSLLPVRLGVRGIQDLREGTISLLLAAD